MNLEPEVVVSSVGCHLAFQSKVTLFKYWMILLATLPVVISWWVVRSTKVLRMISFHSGLEQSIGTLYIILLDTEFSLSYSGIAFPEQSVNLCANGWYHVSWNYTQLASSDLPWLHSELRHGHDCCCHVLTA